jgi:hypothetical protein
MRRNVNASATLGTQHITRFKATAQSGQTYPRHRTSMSLHGGTSGPGSMSGSMADAAGSPTPSARGWVPCQRDQDRRVQPPQHGR